MKTPEEIKMGLEFDIGCCSNCYECSSVDNPYIRKQKVRESREGTYSYVRPLRQEIQRRLFCREFMDAFCWMERSVF